MVGVDEAVPRLRRVIWAPTDSGVHGCRIVLLVGSIVLLWIGTRPYSGIVHDSRFYTLMALRSLEPSRFEGDLFLQFGSQDSFTLFSQAYRPLVAALGPGRAALLLTAAAHGLWLGSAYFLARTLVQDTVIAAAAVAGLVMLPSFYGGGFIFAYGEQFLTPRLFAEAATMAALASMVRGRIGLAVLALAFGVSVHPLMTLPGVGVLLVSAGASKRLWWIAAACAGVAGIGLSASGIEPFARIMVQFDPAWLDVARARSPKTFLLQWSWTDYVVVAGQGAAAAVAFRVLDGRCRSLVRLVALAAACGLGLTILGADVLHNQLLTNLQPWRAAWLLGAVGSLLLIPALLAMARDGGAASSTCRAVVFTGAILLFGARLLPIDYVTAALSLGIGAVLLGGTARHGVEDWRPPRLLIVAWVGLAGAMAWSAARTALDPFVAPEIAWVGAWNLGVYFAGVALAGAALFAPALWRGQSGKLWGTTGLAAAMAIAVAGWDQRTNWQRFIESGDPPPAKLVSFVPQGSTVYWDGGLELLWLRVAHASYYSCPQAAGVIFFRGTALAYAERRESFQFETVRGEVCNEPGDGPAPTISEDELQRACRREPALDFIVSSTRLPGVPAVRWSASVSQWDRYLVAKVPVLRENSVFYRYSCAALR